MTQPFTPTAWDADDNKPVIPKIPNPRTPQANDTRELAVAIHVGQQMLATYGTVDGNDIFAYAQAHGGLAEALRILLRAVDAEPGEGQ